jgi:heavy metal sensor kinase
MRIFKSIKWRLQIWYGLILVLVLAGFGFTAYQLEYGRQMRRVDGELQRRFKTLADMLHDSQHPPQDRPRFDRPPPDQMSDDLPPQQNSRPQKFELPAWAASLFNTNQPDNFYFLIETRDGKEIARAGEVPAYEVPAEPSRQYINRALELQVSKPPPAFTQDNFREIWDTTPSGETIHVGCSIAPELKELDRAALNLAAIGSLILLVGLAGGWWFVSRALLPIENISTAAVKISAGDLSQRINAAEAESELGKLAAVLNSTFARLDAAFAQQKQFASDAAHELRTPVSVILTQTQTALNREREVADYKQTIEACQRAAQRMRNLIASLLELARLDAGQEIMKRLCFDFSKTVADCAEAVRPLADERRVKIFVEAGNLEMTGDPERLAQVVTNLLVNAIQYNKPGGEVRLKLNSQGGLGVLTVADTGQGIAAEDLPRVFERFYRAEKSRSSGNAGLGLAICKAIAETHGGTLEVSSEPGVGSTFILRLPLA